MADKGKNFFDRAREIDEKAKAMEEEEERLAAEEDKKERAEYEKQLQNEKVELMKLKAGVISDDETTIKKEDEPVKEYTFSDKVENFFYHYKWRFIICVFTIAVLTFLICDTIFTVKPDITVMLFTGGYEMDSRTYRMEDWLERYCPDFNGDGRIKVSVYYMAAQYDENDAYSLQAYQVGQTKLVGEFQSENIIMAITSPDVCDELNITRDGLFTDMSALYPDDENAVELGYKISATTFASDIGYPDMPDDYLFCLRNVMHEAGFNEEKMQQNYDKALEVFENIRTDNVINPDIEISGEMQ